MDHWANSIPPTATMLIFLKHDIFVLTFFIFGSSVWYIIFNSPAFKCSHINVWWLNLAFLQVTCVMVFLFQCFRYSTYVLIIAGFIGIKKWPTYMLSCRRRILRKALWFLVNGLFVNVAHECFSSAETAITRHYCSFSEFVIVIKLISWYWYPLSYIFLIYEVYNYQN